MKSVFDNMSDSLVKPKSMMQKLEGYKTYLVMAVLFCWGGAFAMKWVDRDTFEAGAAIISSLGGIAMRKAVANK